ncbi:MAG: type VI secretion system baseplate subunit TssK [Chitinispirillaceae bacterium]
MLDHCRVLWKEGMFLLPQHFQFADHLNRVWVNSRISALQPFYYGFRHLEVDRDMLLGGTFSISRCTGVLPDGSCFSITGDNSEGLSRSFSAFCSHDQQKLDVYLALPMERSGEVCVACGSDAGGYRYLQRAESVHDTVTNTRKKEIDLGIPNYQIRFEGETLDEYSHIKVARLLRNSNGYFEFDENYAPPALSVRCCEYVRTSVRGLLEVLIAKINILSQGRQQSENGLALFSSSDAFSFRLLQTLYTYTPLLNQYHQLAVVHPYDLFTLLTMLCGSLASFSSLISFNTFPRYDHDNLGQTFAALVKNIRSVLDVDITSGCFPLKMEKKDDCTFYCSLKGERNLDRAKLYLGVGGSVSQKELVIGVLQQLKVCSRDKLDLLISSAVPGLTLIHQKTVPEGLATKPGYTYFILDQNGPHWESIQKTGTIGFYFPKGSVNMQFELLAMID